MNGNKKRLRVLILLLCFLLSCFHTPALAEETNILQEPFLLYAVNAGKADALLVRAGGCDILVDAGYGVNRGKILYAMKLLDMDGFDAVFLTHTDQDHAEGLEWLADSDIPVGRWYASAMYTGKKANKHPAVLAAAKRGQEVVWLQAGDDLLLTSDGIQPALVTNKESSGSEAEITDSRISENGTENAGAGCLLQVLAPGKLSEGKDDNNSLVMMLSGPEGRMLLCGDMEYEEEAWLLRSGADLACDVLKVANHGDDDTGSTAFFQAAAPKTAVISTSTAEKASTPDPWLMERLQQTGADILQTQDTEAGLVVALSTGGVRAAAVSLPEQQARIRVQTVDVADDRIILENTGETDADLAGWSLYSEKGGELFIFPQGACLPAGKTLTVGTLSTKGEADLTWPEKKVINRKKTDTVILLDDAGRETDRADNGL